MEPRLARARESVDSAAELTDDSTIHEQLGSIRQALNALSADLPEDAVPESEAPANVSPKDDAPIDATSDGTSGDPSHDATGPDSSAGDAPTGTAGNETPEDEVPTDGTPADDSVLGSRLEEVERQLAQLGDDADGATAEHIATARNRIDEFRRARAQDWE